MTVYLKRCFLISLVATLTACGGGGGGGGSNDKEPDVKEPTSFRSLASANGHYQAIASQAYTGTTAQASLDNETAVAVSQFVFGSDDVTSPLTGGVEPRQVASNFIIGFEQRVLDDANGIKQVTQPQTSNADVSAANTSAIIVDEVERCDAGSMRLKGERYPNQSGAIPLTYNNCRIDDVVVSGEGHISYNDQSGSSAYSVYFDGTQMTTDTGEVFRFFGYVTIDDRSSANEYTVIQDITIVDVNNNHRVKLEGYRQTRLLQQNSLQISGRIIDANYGAVAVQTDGFLMTNQGIYVGGSIVFSSDSSQVAIEFRSEASIVVRLDEDNDGEFDSRAVLDDFDQLVNLSAFQSRVAPIEDNTPPQDIVLALRTSSGDSPNASHDLIADIESFYDADGDTLQTLEFSWYVNGDLVLTSESNQLPAGNGVAGDEISVRVLVSDGMHEVYSDLATVSLTDAPAYLVVNGLPSSAASGATIGFEAKYYDPDDGSSTAAVILDMPSGMTIDEEGQVSWALPSVERVSLSVLSLKVQQTPVAGEYLEYFIQLEDDQLPSPSTIDSVTGAIQQSYVQDVDGDGVNEMLVHDGYKLFLLSYADSRFTIERSYPYGFPTRGMLTKLLKRGSDGEFLVVTEHGVSRIDAQLQNADALIKYQDRSILDAVLDPTDMNRLFILYRKDDKTFLSQVSLDTFEDVGSVLVAGETITLGHFDNNSSQDILVSGSGLLVDSETFNIQSTKTYLAFNSFTVGRELENGVHELVVLDTLQDRIAGYDPRTDTQLWTLPTNGAAISAMTVIQSGDATFQLVFSDAQSNQLNVYRLNDNAPQLSAQLALPSSGNVSAVLNADINTDGASELFFYKGNELIATDSQFTTLYSTPWEYVAYAPLDWVEHQASEWLAYTSEVEFSFTKSLEVLNTEGEFESRLFAADNEFLFTNQFIIDDFDGNGSSDFAVTYYRPDFQQVVGVYEMESLDFVTSETISLPGVNPPIGLKSYDLNGDDRPELLYTSDAGDIKAIDVVNGLPLDLDLQINGLRDFAFEDFYGDATPELIVTSEESTQLMEKETNNQSYDAVVTSLSSDLDCGKIFYVNVDSDAASELLCGRQNIGMEALGLVLEIWDVSETALTRIKTLEIGDAVSNLVVDPDDSSSVYLALVYPDRFATRLQKISLLSEEVSWHGPMISGYSVGNWLVRSRADAEVHGGHWMVLQTTVGMHLFD